jgi:hypothetical protein
MRQVTESLVATLAPLGIERHLNALPFAVLLENIAGLMAPRASMPRCRRISRTASSSCRRCCGPGAAS